MRIDVEFLRVLGIMDYSLLIGIHDMQVGNTGADLKLYEPPKRLFTLPRESMKAVFSEEGCVSSVGMGGVGDLEEYFFITFGD